MNALAAILRTLLTSPDLSGYDPMVLRSDADWQFAVERITLRIRWFGLMVGYLLVNFFSPSEHRPYLNAILTLGALYALFDLVWHWRGEVFLSDVPLLTSLMEAIFIGALCFFDRGLDSSFRYYYFLSLLVCAIRYSPTVTYSTFALHAASYSILAVIQRVKTRDEAETLILMLVFMGWVTWASTALTLLLRQTGQKLSRLNQELEGRIERRTRALQQSQALLVQHEKQAAFGLLAAGIAHEVGNPLAAISSLVQLMNRKKLDPQMHERLGLIDEQLLRIQRTLRELIEFSRPSNSATSRFDVHDVIRNALEIAKYYKRKKGKTIVTNFMDHPPTVTAIRDQILQVFLNLILNAMDATEEGGVIEISTERRADWLHVIVRDNGHGIPEEDQQSLFAPYFTKKATGTGLGLFVCRNIVGAARGTIQLTRSVPGETVFEVLLPCEPPVTVSVAESSSGSPALPA
ncbi:sensor histidine kinase [Planctomicrobium sp. SH664]|uniref:sensor histidine kinase n=1 Tax=Planctomicrobium sp. SH664 TaxID=3448125 RepID=UPI003F5C1DD0